MAYVPPTALRPLCELKMTHAAIDKAAAVAKVEATAAAVGAEVAAAASQGVPVQVEVTNGCDKKECGYGVYLFLLFIAFVILVFLGLYGFAPCSLRNEHGDVSVGLAALAAFLIALFVVFLIFLFFLLAKGNNGC